MIERTAPTASRILIVDDEQADRTLCRRLLENSKGAWQVLEAEVGEEGLACAFGEQPDCILLDYRLPDMDGLEFLIGLAKDASRPPPPVIIMSGQGNEEVAVAALKQGALDYLVKGTVTHDSLTRALRAAIGRTLLERELDDKRRALESANETLRHQNEELQRFHHGVSHELRTPLAAALEFARLMLDDLTDVLAPMHRRHLQFIKDACDQMTVHVKDLVDSARVETGKFTLRVQSADLRSVSRRALTSVSPIARRQDVSLIEDVPASLPAVLIDEVRVVQVLTNLLTNGLKFTPAQGRITLRGRHRPGHPFIVVSVEDTGRGIDSSDLARIFDRSYQIHSSDHVVRGGLGLGLSIAREIVASHGGEIWAESERGGGSILSFSLPLAPGELGKRRNGNRHPDVTGATTGMSARAEPGPRGQGDADVERRPAG
jgi:signal transduction histidine kinase